MKTDMVYDCTRESTLVSPLSLELALGLAAEGAPAKQQRSYMNTWDGTIMGIAGHNAQEIILEV